MIKIEAYQCEYCTKHRKGTGKPIRIYRRRIDTHYHEAGCYYNSQMRAQGIGENGGIGAGG